MLFLTLNCEFQNQDDSEDDTSDIDLFDSSLALDSKADRVNYSDYFKVSLFEAQHLNVVYYKFSNLNI